MERTVDEKNNMIEPGPIRYEDFEDSQLAAMAQYDDGAQEFLLNKYKNLVKSKARSYFLIGADQEDIVQEGMIGLYKAIRDYSEGMSSFRGFAELCITRQIITAIKTATRQKHIPLNSYVSLHRPVYEEDDDRTLMDVVAVNSELDPQEIMISQEDYDAMAKKIDRLLSDLEKEVMELYLEGMSYQEIAVRLNRPEKSVDNALQRIKSKLTQFLH